MQTVRVHAKVLLDYPTTSGLYYVLRSFNPSGSGWINVPKEVLSDFFGRGWQTIKRWFSKGKQQGFFRYVEFNTTHIHVRLSSINHVKAYIEGGVQSSAVIDTSHLRSLKGLKSIAYQMATLRQQQACEHQVQRNTQNSKFIFSPNTSGRKLTRRSGCIVAKTRGETTTYFINRNRNPIGASQITLACKLNKHRVTVQRWLKDIPKAYIYREVKKDDQDLPGYYYRHTYITRGGRTITRTFRRYPNYYFINLDIRKEVSNPVVPPHIHSYNVKNQQEADIQYLLRMRRPSPQSFRDKLIMWFTHEDIALIGGAMMRIFKGNHTPLQTFMDWKIGTLVDALDGGYKSLTNAEQDTCMELVKALRKGRTTLFRLFPVCIDLKDQLK